MLGIFKNLYPVRFVIENYTKNKEIKREKKNKETNKLNENWLVFHYFGYQRANLLI